MNRITLVAGLFVLAIGTTACAGVERQQVAMPEASESAEAEAEVSEEPTVEASAQPAGETPAGTNSEAPPFCPPYRAAMAGIDGAAWNQAGDELAAVGVPAGVTADELAGFKVFVTAAQTMEPQANSLADQAAFLPFNDVVNLEVFLAYAAKTCGS